MRFSGTRYDRSNQKRSARLLSVASVIRLATASAASSMLDTGAGTAAHSFGLMAGREAGMRCTAG